MFLALWQVSTCPEGLKVVVLYMIFGTLPTCRNDPYTWILPLVLVPEDLKFDHVRGTGATNGVPVS